MSEGNIVTRSTQPNTVVTIASDLRQLGLIEGDAVIVHSSLSSIGWVCGGAQAVIEALIEVVTSEGTIVMPAHTAHLGDPSGWQNPPVPESWWETIRQTMSPFRPEWTPTYHMGRIAETFRSIPGATRSSHPQTSFAAWGAHAERITADQSLNYGMGEQSPLARLYDLSAKVLLLGVGYDSNTSFHLAEYRANSSPHRLRYAPILSDGRREWVEFDELDFRTDEFDQLGQDFEASATTIRHGQIGLAESRLFSQRACIDYATEWLKKNPIRHD